MRKKIKSGPTQIVLIVGHCVGLVLLRNLLGVLGLLERDQLDGRGHVLDGARLYLEGLPTEEADRLFRPFGRGSLL